MAQTAIDYLHNLLQTCLQRVTYLIAQTTKRHVGHYEALTRADSNTEPPHDLEAKPRYRLDDETSGTMTLPDGRKLGFATFGDPAGKVIFHLHGFPGSRSQAAVYEEPAQKLGLRIIAVDRPGCGLSSPQHGRTALDHAEDILHLTKHLNIQQYAVLGLSGGGLYALACTKKLPKENLKAISLVGGIGPHDIGTKGMKSGNCLLFAGFRYWPSAVRWLVQRIRTAIAKVPEDVLLNGLQWKPRYPWLLFLGPTAKDLEAVRDRDFMRLMFKSNREFGVLGMDSFMDEGRIYTTDCGFRVEDIDPELPVQLWYGKQDTNVPLRVGEQIAVRFGGRATLIVEDETHMSLLMSTREEVLKHLARCL